MRTESSIKNSILASMVVIVQILIGFIAQKIFVVILNAEYLGANGLFSNVIRLLSLAELGIGQAIIFNLYKPIANNDRETIKSLMSLYKKAYVCIALVVFFVGISLIPFLDFFIGETTLDLNFTLVYVLFLLQSVISYVATYKRTILYAYQQNYIISIINMIFLVFMNVAQLMMLFITKNYYLYLLIKTLCILAENLVITYIANKKYPFVNEGNVKKLDTNIEKDIVSRVKAEIFHKVGGVVVTGTDNIIISKFLGLLTVGLYSNYYMILYSVGELMRQMIIAIIPSVGNLLTENDKERSFDIYKKVRFLNFWLATFSCVAILVIIQSFITLWMGESYLISLLAVMTLVVNQYLKSMRSTNDVFLSAAGICVETRFVPIFESILNIIFSILLIKPFGLAGVFMGTIISSLPLWCYSYPKFGYKKILGGKYSDYIKENLGYFLLFTVIAISTYGISMTFTISNLWLDVIARCMLCLIVPNLILFLIYRKSEEFEYFKNLLKFMLKRKNKEG